MMKYQYAMQLASESLHFSMLHALFSVYRDAYFSEKSLRVNHVNMHSFRVVNPTAVFFNYILYFLIGIKAYRMWHAKLVCFCRKCYRYSTL